MPWASKFIPLWKRSDEWQARLQMIRSAREFIYISIFYIEYDEFGREFLQELNFALDRGVRVVFVIDRFGQWLGGHVMEKAVRAALQKKMDALKKKGARIFFYIPPHRVQRWLGGGQHVKIQLSDAGEAIFGSSNISHASFAAWNDFSVLLAGEIILEFAESFRTLGFPLERNHLLTLKKLIQNSIPEYNFTYHVFDPNKHQGVLGPLFWRKKNTITEAMVQLFEEARESVFLTSFYFKPTKKLFRAMLRAARRGVKITIFHSHRAALDATDLAWIAAAVKFDLLLKAKIRIFENKKGEHSKLVLVDGMKAALGSYNFEDAAHDRLAEAMLVTREKKVVESIQQIFDLLKRNSQNILVKKLWRKRLRFRLRIRIRLWGVFKRWL